MKRSFALIIAIFLAGCAFPIVPAALENNCAKETSGVEAEKYLVSILASSSETKLRYLGSGSAILKNGKTFVVTSAHVALKNTKTGEQRPDGLFVEFNRGPKRMILDASVAAVNTKSDIALLRISYQLQPVAKLSTREITPGSCVVAVGRGFAGEKPARVSGNFYGYFPLSVGAWGVKVDALIITAHIMEGMSGGPVFNKDGEVIGIANNSVVMKNKDGTEMRFSLAIPISELPNLP